MTCIISQLDLRAGTKGDDNLSSSGRIKVANAIINKEKGVRNLKRCLETIYTKLNLFRLMKSETNLFDKDISLKVEFPFTVTPDIIQKLVKKNDNVGVPYGMYV